MHVSKTLSALACAAAGLAAAGAAQAQWVAITQSTANSGSLIGDEPGFPITIASPGLYVVTSQLTAPPGASAIVVTTAGVTIDLNGQTIIAAGGCQQTPGGGTSCPAGARFGIQSTHPGATIRNGRIWGFPGAAIDIVDGVIENVLIESNKTGIKASTVPSANPTRISGVRVVRNQSGGITTQAALIERSVIARNSIGVSGSGASIIDSMVIDNATYGVMMDDASHALPHQTLANSALKGTILRGNGQAIYGNVRSLGGNLVDNVPF